jgi:hypothetical protein
MAQFVRDEIARLKVVLFRELWVAPHYARPLCRGIFTFRTPCIGLIEHVLGTALHVGIFSAINGANFTQAIEWSLDEAFAAVSHDLIADLLEMDLAARRIQRAWRRVIADPVCVPCRSRLAKEFKECQSLLQR